KDRDVGSFDPAAPSFDLNRYWKIPFHVVYRDAVLVEQRTGDSLPDRLITSQLDGFVRDVVNDLVLAQGLRLAWRVGVLLVGLVDAGRWIRVAAVRHGVELNPFVAR